MASEPVVIPLATSAAHRRRLWAGSAAAALVVAALVLIAVAGGTGAVTGLGRAALGVAAVGVGAVAAGLARTALVPAGSVTIDAKRLRIEEPELLREPIDVPRTALRTLLVDGRRPAPAAGLPAALAPRFALVETGEQPAWLHPAARGALPYLGWTREAPNLAVVLRSR